MPIALKGRDFLTLEDFRTNEIQYLLDLSHDLKTKKRTGIKNNLLQGKNIVLLFEKASTRTRCAFEVAAYDEGANITFLTGSQMGKKESIEDTAKVLSRFYDGIEFRGFKQATVDEIARHACVPVWNGLTDYDHPTQVLADLMTIKENCHKPLNQVKMVYCGDARNNMGNALLMGAAKMGMHFVSLAPKNLWQEEGLVSKMKVVAEQTGATLEFFDINDKEKALKDADVIYTDVWVSMGEEDKFEERIKMLQDYRVTMDFIKLTKNPNAIFLHCLPAFHDTMTEVGAEVSKKFNIKEMEVSDEVFRSKHSKVFDQAENRMHTIKAVMVATLVS